MAAGLVSGFAAAIHERAQDAVDVFGGATGADDTFKQVEQILGQGVRNGVVYGKFGNPLAGFDERLCVLTMSVTESMFQTPQTGNFGLEESRPLGIGKVLSGSGLSISQGLGHGIQEG